MKSTLIPDELSGRNAFQLALESMVTSSVSVVLRLSSIAHMYWSISRWSVMAGLLRTKLRSQLDKVPLYHCFLVVTYLHTGHRHAPVPRWFAGRIPDRSIECVCILDRERAMLSVWRWWDIWVIPADERIFSSSTVVGSVANSVITLSEVCSMASLSGPPGNCAPWADFCAWPALKLCLILLAQTSNGTKCLRKRLWITCRMVGRCTSCRTNRWDCRDCLVS